MFDTRRLIQSAGVTQVIFCCCSMTRPSSKSADDSGASLATPILSQIPCPPVKEPVFQPFKRHIGEKDDIRYKWPPATIGKGSGQSPGNTQSLYIHIYYCVTYHMRHLCPAPPLAVAGASTCCGGGGGVGLNDSPVAQVNHVIGLIARDHDLAKKSTANTSQQPRACKWAPLASSVVQYRRQQSHHLESGAQL